MRPSRSPSGSTPTHTTSPAAISVSSCAGCVIVDPGGQHFRFEHRCGNGHALQLFDGVQQRFGPSAAGRDAVPRHAGTARSASVSTGSISRRSRARERRRTMLQHVGVDPLTLSSAGAEFSMDDSPVSRDALQERRLRRRRPSPYRAANSAAVKAPCDRANRSARSAGRILCTASSNASGTPGGTRTPIASRYRATSSTAMNLCSPPIATATIRPASFQASNRGRRRLEARCGRRSRRGSDRRCGAADRAASRSSELCTFRRDAAAAVQRLRERAASSRSRSSASPSSSRSCAWSTESACARRSASGASPS